MLANIYNHNEPIQRDKRHRPSGAIIYANMIPTTAKRYPKLAQAMVRHFGLGLGMGGIELEEVVVMATRVIVVLPVYDQVLCHGQGPAPLVVGVRVVRAKSMIAE
jgi:hypothetical protein